MDERKYAIKSMEEKKKTDIEERNRLLEELGLTLLLRIGEGEPFLVNVDDEPGAVLIEYRKLQKEIAESLNNIKAVETAIERFKELEEAIAVKEEDYSRLEKELADVHIELGKALLVSLDTETIADPSRMEEESLLFKIEELEKKLEGLEAKEGGFFNWLGKNAQMAVSKALLLRNQSALQKVYRSAGEKFLSRQPVTLADMDQDSDSIELLETRQVFKSMESLSGDTAETAERAFELRKALSSLTDTLILLKDERKIIGDLYGTGASPSRRIQGIQKQIADIKSGFPQVYLRFGSLAAEYGGKGVLSSLVTEEEKPVLEKARFLKIRIAEKELEIEKIKAAIGIDDEKAGIEKIRKAILLQREKISGAEEAIVDLEKEIGKSEQHIEELKTFISNGADTGAQKEDHGSENKEGGETGKESGFGGGKKRNSGKGNSRKGGAGAGRKKEGG